MRINENNRKNIEEEDTKYKSECTKLRKEMSNRMEELREYMGVCSKFEQTNNILS